MKYSNVKMSDETREELKDRYGSIQNAVTKAIELLLDPPKDHCEKCGCSEWLCGHNQRG